MTALFNQRLVKNYCCAQCFGPLVEKFIDDQYQVVCPRNCQPGGFVTQAWAAEQKAENHVEAIEVVKNYPELATTKPLSADERAADKRALYGEGD